MTADAILVVRFLFTSIWSLFTNWTFPGTRVSPAEWALFALTFWLVLRLLRRYFMDGGDDK